MMIDDTIYTESPVELEIALRLETLGFNESCFYARDIESGNFDVGKEYTGALHITPEDIINSRENEFAAVLAPTRTHVASWLRRKYLININITSASLESYTVSITSHESTKWNLGYGDLKEEDFDTYEEALERGIELCLDLLEKGL